MRLLDHLPRAKLAEGPLWEAETGSLYWVDIAGHAIHRHHPASGACATHLPLFGSVGFCALAGGGRLVAGIGGGLFDLAFGQAGETLVARPVMHGENRFNDGKCDPRGRALGRHHASRGPSRARAHRRALPMESRSSGGRRGAGVALQRARLEPVRATMYFSDTHAGTVWAYNYELATGEVSHRRAFATVPVEEGVPDGLAVDAGGRVHVAIWRGGRIDVYAPDGVRETQIAVPVRNPTSCGFGGADLRTLYVTTMPSSARAIRARGRCSRWRPTGPASRALEWIAACRSRPVPKSTAMR